MDSKTSEAFEAALREVGLQRLRLDQVVTAYQRTFPQDAMRADMRRRLHDAILDLVQIGAVSVPHGDGLIDEDPMSLPQAVEMMTPVTMSGVR